MAQFNLIRKRRRRIPPMAIAIGVVVIVFIAVIIGGSFFLKKQERKKYGTTIKIAKLGPLTEVRARDGESKLNYTAETGAATWPRGAQVAFSVLPNSGTGEGIKVRMLELVVRSFTPLDKLPTPPEYAPPISSAESETGNDVDVAVRILVADKPSASITWSPQIFEVGPEDWARQGKPTGPAPYPCGMELVPSPIAVPLSSINRPKVHEFVAQLILDTPGKAEVGFRISYMGGEKAFTAESQDPIVIVYNPASDVGSTSFLKADYEAHPSFAGARAYRDKLLAEGNGRDALAVARDFRSRNSSSDANWLLGDTFRALGKNQEALDNGLYAFYLQSDDLSGEKLLRWTENKKWLTEKVQAGIVKLPRK